MREATFRRYLNRKLKPDSVRSYISYANRVEAELALDLDLIALDEAGVALLRDRLRIAKVDPKSVSNCLSAVRAYGRMRGDE